MDNSFHKILNPPSSSYPPISGPQASFEASNKPIDLSLADTDVNSPSDNSKKRPASRIKSSYPRKRAIQACQKCRVRRTKCDNQRPTCSSCADLGVECSYSEGDPSSFDAASLAILEKLGNIEQLLKSDDRPNNRARRPSLAGIASNGPDTASPLSRVKSLNSPSLERTTDNAIYQLNIERMLAWPVFADLRPCLDLRQLLNATNDSQAQASSTANDYELPPWTDQMVQNFMNEVYIFNPVIEEAKIQKYIRDVRFAGFGHDGASCLLVSLLPYCYLNTALTVAAPHICSWLSVQLVRNQTTI
jgi:hypothetical protein